MKLSELLLELESDGLNSTQEEKPLVIDTSEVPWELVASCVCDSRKHMGWITDCNTSGGSNAPLP